MAYMSEMMPLSLATAVAPHTSTSIRYQFFLEEEKTYYKMVY